MACTSCGRGNKKEGICDVHSLVDGDNTIRTVRWCKMCNAYVCAECRYDYPKRAKAAIIRQRNRNRL